LVDGVKQLRIGLKLLGLVALMPLLLGDRCLAPAPSTGIMETWLWLKNSIQGETSSL
jgi:hypothetical protein